MYTILCVCVCVCARTLYQMIIIMFDIQGNRCIYFSYVRLFVALTLSLYIGCDTKRCSSAEVSAAGMGTGAAQTVGSYVSEIAGSKRDCSQGDTKKKRKTGQPNTTSEKYT